MSSLFAAAVDKVDSVLKSFISSFSETNSRVLLRGRALLCRVFVHSLSVSISRWPNHTLTDDDCLYARESKRDLQDGSVSEKLTTIGELELLGSAASSGGSAAYRKSPKHSSSREIDEGIADAST